MPELPTEEHGAAVRDLFRRIGPRYDLLNRIMTGGRDAAWKRKLVDLARLPRGGLLLDVGAGTGDIVREAARRDPRLVGVGADACEPMIRRGRARRPVRRVQWCAADAALLPFPDACFDAVVSGYLLRNVRDVGAVLREQVRVVKPGGRVVCLETSPPPADWRAPFIRMYLRRGIPAIGRWMTGDRDAYAYLGRTTEAFLAPEQLAGAMAAAGLAGLEVHRLAWGAIAIHAGTRRAYASGGELRAPPSRSHTLLPEENRS